MRLHFAGMASQIRSGLLLSPQTPVNSAA